MSAEEIKNNQENQKESSEGNFNNRQQRLADINNEISSYQYTTRNDEDINKITIQKDKEFQDIIKNLEIQPGHSLIKKLFQ
jgi:hypothetical protein